MIRLSAAIAAALLVVGAGASSSAANATTSSNTVFTYIATVPNAFVLDLGGERFDPLYAALAGSRGTSEGEDLRLVQFEGPIRTEWLATAGDAGVVPMQYIHPYTYVVWADNEQLAELAGRGNSGVRWAGDFLPTYGVQPHLRGGSPAIKNTMALISRHADENAFRDAAEATGASVLDITPVNGHFSVVHLNAPGNRYLDLASIRGVYTVQEIQPLTAEEMLRGEMSNQAVVGNYNPNPPNFTIFPGYLSWLNDTGYDGDGVIVGIVDGGVRISHQDLAGNVSPCVSAGGSPTTCGHSNDDHGTHVAGAVAGTGVTGTLLNGFLRGQGVAPGASVVEQLYGPFLGGGPGGMRPSGMLTMFKESSLSSAVMTNNSWGPTGSPQGYDIPTQQVDIVARDANPDIAGNQQILNVWSIMNGEGDGNGACAPASVASPDEAKNLFAVGSTTLQSGAGTQLVSIFDVSWNSAHGNACDGRRIPHIVAPGCSTDSLGHISDTAHASGFCGTSMASPVVSGAVAIFIEKYRAEHGGDTPSPALVKAAFTPVATDLEGFRNADNGVMGHRPDRFQGYGRLDLDAVANPTEAVFYQEQDEVLTTGDSWSVELTAEDPDQPIRIMLAWTDAAGHGLGGTTPAWVNNLDLEVDADGGTFLGNVVGTDGWSATGGSADDRNNLEGVFLSPEQHGGAITITVNGTNVAADALNPIDPGMPGQDFALVCYNCTDGEGPPPVDEADLGVNLFALPDNVEAGETVTFLAQVGNFGPDAATDVVLSLALPPAFSFVGTALEETSRSQVIDGAIWTCSETDGAVDCAFAGTLANSTLAPGLLIEASVNSNAPVGTTTVVASVSNAIEDPNAANDTASADVEITGVKDVIFANDFECADGLGGCDTGGGTPGVYTSRDAFLANVPAGYYEEDFADVPLNLVQDPLSFTGGGITYTVYSSSAYVPGPPSSGGLYNGPGFISTNSDIDAIVITVTSGTLMAVGGNFWATDELFAPLSSEVTITLSDGTVETFTATSAADFRGFVAKAPITTIEIDAPAQGKSDEVWATLDNLIVSQ